MSDSTGVSFYHPFSIVFEVRPTAWKRGEDPKTSDDLVELLAHVPAGCALGAICYDDVHFDLPKIRRVGNRSFELQAMVDSTTTAEKLVTEMQAVFWKNGWSIVGMGAPE